MADESYKERLVERYYRAFSLANPDARAPVLTYRRGWFSMRDAKYPSLVTKYRIAQIEQMVERLTNRAA